MWVGIPVAVQFERNVPQRLKPRWQWSICGTAEAVPLTKLLNCTATGIFSPQCRWTRFGKGDGDCLAGWNQASVPLENSTIDTVLKSVILCTRSGA